MNKNRKMLSMIVGVLAVLLGWGGYETLGNPDSQQLKETKAQETVYDFASEEKLNQHYEKHKDEFDLVSEEEYLALANQLLLSEGEAVLVKQQDDGDTAYYNEDTNEFAVLSADGVIRTYFKPEGGIKYFNRQ